MNEHGADHADGMGRRGRKWSHAAPGAGGVPWRARRGPSPPAQGAECTEASQTVTGTRAKGQRSAESGPRLPVLQLHYRVDVIVREELLGGPVVPWLRAGAVPEKQDECGAGSRGSSSRVDLPSARRQLQRRRAPPSAFPRRSLAACAPEMRLQRRRRPCSRQRVPGLLRWSFASRGSPSQREKQRRRWSWCGEQKTEAV